MDFVYYWIHFTYHKSRWFWATHVVHHSSEHFNLTTALRQQWTNGISGTVLFKFPLVLIGFHPNILVFVMAINLNYQFWFHTETIDKMPRWFEAVMNTPSHHRVHHGRKCTVFRLQLRRYFLLFGTKCLEHLFPNKQCEKVEYGIVKPLDHISTHLLLLFMNLPPLLKMCFPKALVLGSGSNIYLLAPGYSHDQSRDTVAQIKSAYLEPSIQIKTALQGFPKS